MLFKETISVIGLGYVGLPVAVAFGQQRPVIAFDINRNRLEELRKGQDRTSEVTTEELKGAELLLTDNPVELRQASIHILTVAYKMYRDWIPQEWLKLLLTQGVVIDVKNVVPAKQLEEAGYLVWKL